MKADELKRLWIDIIKNCEHPLITSDTKKCVNCKKSMKLEEISKELQESALSPGRLSELHISLAGEYAFISSRLSEVLKVEDKLWNAIREHTDTDAKANRLWGALPEIIDMKVYKQELKVVEKIMASIRLRISTLSEEAHNQF